MMNHGFTKGRYRVLNSFDLLNCKFIILLQSFSTLQLLFVQSMSFKIPYKGKNTTNFLSASIFVKYLAYYYNFTVLLHFGLQKSSFR